MHRVLTLLTSLLAAAALAACGSSTSSTSATSSTATTSPATASAHAKPRLVARTAAVPGTKATVATVARLSHPPRAHRRAHLAGLDGLSLSQKLGVLVPQSAELWQIAFRRAGAQLPAANAYLVSAGQTATCGSTSISATSPPEYCPTDGGIYLTADYLQSKIGPLGDAALLLIVSDLYGLHVENALGVLSSFTPAQIELTDACFAGEAFDYADYKHQLQPSDEQAVNNLLTLEAPVAGTGSPGAVTASALTTAFNRGLLSGLSFQKCLPAGK